MRIEFVTSLYPNASIVIYNDTCTWLCNTMILLYLQNHETIALGDVQVHVGDADEVGITSVV